MLLSNSPSRFVSQPLTHSAFLSNPSRMDIRKRQIQENRRYHQMAAHNFPFGKQGIKISQFVSDQLNSKEQQDNARILEQFRRKAVEDKFHNKYGHLQNSRIMQKYITENMMPGVTLNPSIVDNLSHDQNNYSTVNPYSHQKVNLSQHYTHPVNVSKINLEGNLFNSRKKQQRPLQYHSLGYSALNPEKFTISSEVQTQENSPEMKKLREVDLERKYYKQKLKNSKKELKNFDKLQKMLKQLNEEIRQNSKFIEKAIIQNQKPKKTHKRGRIYTLRQQFDAYDEDKQRYARGLKPRLKTENNKEHEILQNWKLNQQILYSSSTSSSFFDESDKKGSAKPKIQYTLQPDRNLQKMENFVKPLHPQSKPSRNRHESTRDYRLKDHPQEGGTAGMAKIREHLKLLKRHTGRLETINSYSLVS